MYRTIGWASTVLLVAALSACGGGGGDSGVAPTALKTTTKELPTGHTAADSGHSEDQSQLATKAGDGTDSALRPLAASRFSRANTYQVYAANGSNKLLRLDFGSNYYEMLDGAGQSTSGTFFGDPGEPGTYVFTSARPTSEYNTARFRLVQGAVVGAFPAARAYADGSPAEVQAFVAANNFIDDGALIDGDYAALETNRAPTGVVGGGVISTRITDAGTRMTTCMSSSPYTIESCPSGLRRAYALRQTGDLWHATSTLNARDQFDFRIAVVGGERVYLSVGTFKDLMDIGGPERTGLRVGVPVTSEEWPLSFGTGAMAGAWGRYDMDGLHLTAQVKGDNGVTSSVAGSLSGPLSADLPGWFLPGVRSLRFIGNSVVGYAAQNRALLLAWGGPAAASPGLSVAVVQGSRPDARTGRYKLFSVHGQPYTLDVDLAERRYSVSSATGLPAASGSIRPNSDAASYTLIDAGGVESTQASFANDAAIGVVALPVAPEGTLRKATFVAARSFVTQQTALAVLPRMYGHWVSLGNGALQMPPVSQFISSNGDTLSLCLWMVPVGVSAMPCPVEGLQPLSVTPGSEPGAWRATAAGAPTTGGEEFYVARIGTDHVYLSASNGIFKIGLDMSDAAPPWGWLSGWSVRVRPLTPWAPEYNTTTCFGAPWNTCSLGFPTTSSVNTWTAATYDSPSSPFRYATPNTGTGNYVIHQGRKLMIIQGNSGGQAEFSVTMNSTP